MALRVWLPLNGNLENKGLSNLTFRMQGTLNTTVGKIGQTTYLIDDATQYSWIISNEKINLGTNITMCAWVRASTFVGADTVMGIFGQHRYNNNTGMGLNFVRSTDTTGKISVNTGTGSSRTYNTYKNTTLLQSNTWYHLGFTYDGSKIRFYVNGILDKEHFYTGQSNIEDYIELYGWSLTGDSVYGNYKLRGAINDVRIYDECLSPKQIKEISKGLIAHYKFDNINSVKTDCSGYRYEGTEHGGTWVLNDSGPRYSGNINFTSHYLDYIPGGLHSASNAFTISCWFYPTEKATMALYNNRTQVGNGVAIFYIDGLIRFDTGNEADAHLESGSITVNAWNFITCAYDSDKTIKKTYINGIEVGSTSVMGSLADISTNASIGNSSSGAGAGAGNQVKGYMSDFRIYCTALSADDIKELYQTSAIVDNNQNIYAYEFKEV